MPHKVDPLSLPEWVRELAADNFCLYETTFEALVAKSKAVQFGAEENPSCKKLMRTADKTLEQLQYHRPGNRSANKLAADAIRKYTLALACVRKPEELVRSK